MMSDMAAENVEKLANMAMYMTLMTLMLVVNALDLVEKRNGKKR